MRILQLCQYISIVSAGAVRQSYLRRDDSFLVGQFPVTIEARELTDYGRLDPFAPKKTPRSVMVSILSRPQAPCKWIGAPYMPPFTASVIDEQFSEQFGSPPGVIANATMQVCSSKNLQQCDKREDLPLAVFSPGLGAVRFIYSIIAAELAALGKYRVAIIDHPYDAPVVELSDGMIIYGLNFTTEDQILETEKVRTADISFVRRSLSAGRKTVAYGHSLGGASAVSALGQDPLLLGALNLDGTLWGSVIQTGTPPGKPVLLFAHDVNTTSPAPIDPTWTQIWPHLRGWKKVIELEGSQHSTFTDLAYLANLLLEGAPLPPAWEAQLGTINGQRALDIVVNYVDAFLKKALGLKPSKLLNGPSSSYPEVLFIQ